MSAEHKEHESLIVIDNRQTLVALPVLIDGQEATEYFVVEHLPSSEKDIQDALNVIGAWSDGDWEEMEQALYDIRHASKPTPPINLLDE